MSVPSIDKDAVVDRLRGRYLAFYESFGLEFNRDNRTSCPIHKGDGQNFSVNPETGEWFCHSACKAGGDVFAFVERLEGIKFADALARVADWAGVVPTAPVTPAHTSKQPPKVACRYDYHDEDGTLLFQVERIDTPTGKTFRQRRPNGKGGWVYNLEGVRRVIYRLPQVVAAIKANKTVYVVEGEKDVENLEALGITATTNAMGAEKWLDEYGEFFVGAKVIIVPDNDKPGRSHARIVAASLYKRTRRIRIVELPELSEKGDVSDWLAAGHSKAELYQLASATPNWTPAVDVSSSPSDVAAFVKQYIRDYENDEPIEIQRTIAKAVYDAVAEPQEKEISIMRLDTFSDIAEDAAPAVAEGLLTQHDLILLTGKPKSGKSFLILQILDDICRGRPLFGQYTVAREGPVVYLGMEDNPNEITRRCRKRGMIGENLPFYLINGRIQLGSADGIMQLEAMIAKANLPGSPVTLVVDTARIGMGIDDWNDSGEVTRRMMPLLEFARRTCLVIVVAHNRKAAGNGGDVISGSNALQSISDGYMIMGDKKALDNGDMEVDLYVETRTAPSRTITLRMDTHTLAIRSLTPDEEVTRAAQEQSDREYEAMRKIALAIDKLQREKPHSQGYSAAAIAKASNISKPTARKYLQKMLESKYIRETGFFADGERGPDACSYRLTTEGGVRYLFGETDPDNQVGNTF